MTPPDRITHCNQKPLRPQGDYVLYWMIATRRASWNFALDHAIAHAHAMDKPLVVLEALRCDYPWASERFHRFIIDGMHDNAQNFQNTPALYFPYVEPQHRAGSGLLKALAENACVVVTDDFPCFFLPKMIDAAARKVPTRLEKIDSNGILPMRASPKVWSRAVDMRRFLQKTLHAHFDQCPSADPFAGHTLPSLDALPEAITTQWPQASTALLNNTQSLAEFPIDHRVAPVPNRKGGATAAQAQLDQFFEARLSRYVNDTKKPMDPAHSGLSPYLHFGHISAHAVFHALTTREKWSPAQLSTATPRGKREGWWGMSTEAESFLDELITWREIGYNMCHNRVDVDQFETLPAWALKTLDDHRDDPRPYTYTLEQFDNAQTHDPLWNAAQVELRLHGTIHSYIRMLWGKKILHWTKSPEDALAILIELNNKYALDGRNPNSYSGIMWCFGRYDRAWGPERPIFGKVRYMTSDSTSRKLRVRPYIAEFNPVRLT